MNLLQPQIVVVNRRRYRKNPVSFSGFEEKSYEPYVEETADMFYYESTKAANKEEADSDEPCDLVTCSVKSRSGEDEDYSGIQPSNNGSFKYTMIVHESYFGFLIGRSGEKKSRLERETKTQLKLPKRGQGDWVVIEGKDKANIVSCKNRILLQITEARHKKAFTHLLTFPLNFPGLQAKLNQFEKEVLKHFRDDRGIDDSIFQYPNKIHLTICTAVLLNENEVDQAVNLMQECRKTFIKDLLNSKPLTVEVKGLEYMNDDPSEVDVLYAKVRPVLVDSTDSNPIQQIADKLMNEFVNAGLSKRQYDRVKLHVTVMNSLMRTDPSGTSETSRKPNTKFTDRDRESFDARNILKSFGDFDFGVYNFDQIHLSLRFSSGPDGYYECISKIDLKP